ncbi:MAG: hypothetical protein KKB20_27365 [Proteobacteria bacterium]|nr:hypothetical protein [Pseudomonadota bacterium]
MRDRPKADLVSIFLVSAGALAFEVILTRVFALAFWHHFASLLIALALTGFGAAGSLLALAMPWLKARPAAARVLTAWAASAAMPLCCLAALAIGLEPPALAWAPGAWLDLALVCLVLVPPFLLAAAHIGLILAWTERPGPAYAANLAGSAAGCLLAALLLSRLPPNMCVYPGAALVLAGSAVRLPDLSFKARSGWVLATAVLAALVMFRPVPLDFADFKDRSAALAARGGRVVRRAVGLQGLVEVIGGPAFHYARGLSLSCAHPLPEQRGLFLDGDLVGPLTREQSAGQPPDFVRCLLIRTAYTAIRPGPVLILAPGAGLGLLAASSAGAGPLTTIEENPQIFDLMTRDQTGFTGRRFRRPGVKALRDDPFRFLDRAGPGYDLIVLGEGGRWPGGSASGLGVTRLLTVQGIGRMLERLTPQGALALTGPLDRPPRTSVKLLATAAEALKNSGRSPAAALALVRDWNDALILVKPAGFTLAEQDRLRESADDLGFDLSVLPGLRPEELNRFHVLPGEPLAEAAELVLDGRSRELFDRAWFDLRPATRDRPYFFHFFRLKTLGLILSRGRGPVSSPALAATEWGLLFTWGGLAATLVLAGAGILLPLARTKPRPPGLAYFGLIGLGYMLAEITLLAETVCRIGRPALAVPGVIGVFLLLSGLGSRLWGDRRPARFALASAATLPLALLGLRYLPGGAWVAGLALAPAALVMGAPFAGGLTHLAGSRPEARAWAFGMNGFMSVAGSLAATLVCLQAGHLAAIAAAAGCYLLAALAGRRGTRGHPPSRWS